MKTRERLGRIEDWLNSGQTITDSADHYSEPGYDLPEGKMVLFGNWWGESLSRKGDPTYVKDDDPVIRVGKVLERCGHELEWLDEWWVCSECGGAVRNTSDSYSWRPYYHIFNECEPVCGDCIKADPSAYIEDLLNNDEDAVTFDLNLTALGFEQVPEDVWYENGWHPGQDDDPREIGPRMTPEGHDRIWLINSVGQFDMRFTMWTRPEGWEAE